MDYREHIDSHLLDKFKALLLQGKSAEDILSSEISLYHKLTKDPDTYESYARYYNSLQFLHMVLGDSVQEEELKLDKCVLNKFFESIVIVKGGLDLALQGF